MSSFPEGPRAEGFHISIRNLLGPGGKVKVRLNRNGLEEGSFLRRQPRCHCGFVPVDKW